MAPKRLHCGFNWTLLMNQKAVLQHFCFLVQLRAGLLIIAGQNLLSMVAIENRVTNLPCEEPQRRVKAAILAALRRNSS